MAKKKQAKQEKTTNEGEMSRRDFLRTAAVVGATLGAANIVAGCNPQPTSGSPTSTVQDVTGGRYLRMDDNNNRPTMPSDYKPAPTFTPQPEVEWVGRTVSTPTPRGSYSPEWFCSTCGKHFPTLGAYQQHAVDTHTRRLPEIRQVDRPTYEQFIVQPLERFDERNTVFSRTDLDAEYQTRRNAAPLKNIINPAEALEGQALLAGGIYVDNKAGTLHEKYYGYFAHVRGAGGLYDWDEPVNTKRYPVDDPAAMSTRVKEVARIYGADLVGITSIDQRWVYSDWFERATQKTGKLVVNKKYAIVLAIEMNGSLINQSPGLESSAEVALAYSRMAEVAASLAAYIRALGYAATPHGNDTTQSIPLAIDAGLGELGRNGLLLTPEYGSRVRLCKVLTDLPLMPDIPIDFGLQKFCETCHACAQACPMGAIRNGDRTTEITSISNRVGLNRWPVNVEDCYIFWRMNRSDCANCIAACPWSLQSPRDWLDL